jgi:HEPN domain-containing protein
MAITADTYRRAAGERAAEALALHEAGSHVLAHYVAGLAVECVLRAYRLRLDPHFESRHDLPRLCKEARFYDFLPQGDVERVSAAVTEVALRWSNSHRYRDRRELRHWLAAGGQDRRVRGDVVKYSSRRIVDAATDIVTAEDLRWPSGS